MAADTVVITVPAAREGDKLLYVIVEGNNIEKALKILKRKLQREGVFRELKKRRFYEKPSIKKKHKQQEAERRRRKTIRFSSFEGD